MHPESPTVPEVRTVAVIGLGAMGLPMAARLAGEYRVVGFDLDAARSEAAALEGVEPCASVGAAAGQADAVLLMVRTPDQLHDLLGGDTGLAASLRPGSLVIVCSTIGVDAVRDAGARLGERGLHLVDAPVSGGPRRAREGDLLIVVGASPEAERRARPVLERLSSTLRIMGDAAGAGQAFKTVNQLLCGIHIAAGAEALALAERFGLDLAATLETLQAGAAASFMLGDRGPRVLQARTEGSAPVASRLDIFVKDLGLVTEAASAAKLATPVASAAHQLFLTGLARGLGDQDDSSVIAVLSPGAGSAL